MSFKLFFFFFENTETRTWKKVEPAGAPPVSRFGYVAVVHSHYFCLFGGYDGTTWLNDMHRFNFGESRLLQYGDVLRLLDLFWTKTFLTTGRTDYYY